MDPREHLFVAGGAAAGLHVVPICRELGTREALMPETAGGLSAVGGLFGDVVGEYAAGYFTESHRFNFDEVNTRLEELEEKGTAFLDRAGIPKERRTLEFYCEARYPYQIWELPVPMKVRRFRNDQEVEQLVEDFHGVHERIFAVKEDTYIECIHWRVRAVGETTKPRIVEMSPASEDPSAALIGKRKVYLGPDEGWIEASIYSGDKLRPGNRLAPPSIVQEATTTLAVLPGSVATYTKYGNYLIELC